MPPRSRLRPDQHQDLHKKEQIPAAYRGPFDSFTSIENCYSIRRLRSSYTGPLLKIRRSSDSTELDIGYDSIGNLNLADATTFIGNGAGFITVWYDQSGNARNLTPSALASQPQLILSSVNGLPAIKWDGSNDLLTASYPTSTIASSMHIVSRTIAFFTFKRIVEWVSTGNNPHSLTLGPATGQLLAGGKTTGHLPMVNPVALGTHCIKDVIFATEASVSTYINGTAPDTFGSSTSTVPQGASFPDATLAIGGRPTDLYWNGEVAELVITSIAWDQTTRESALSISNSYFNCFVPTPDITMSIESVSSVTSRMDVGMGLITNPPLWAQAGWNNVKASLASFCGAYKVHIYPFGLLDPWASDSGGKTENSPSNLTNSTANYLKKALISIRDIDAVAPIILTLYGAMWWMKQTLNANTIADLDIASRYSASGRVKNSALADWLILVDAAVELAASYGARDFEIWNEGKGFYDVYPHVGQKWDATMNSGNGVDNLVMGFGYFYKQTATQVVTTMTRLGYARNTYRIGGPYAPFTTQAIKTTDSVPSTNPLYAYAAQFGYIEKEAVDFSNTFLDNVHAGSISSTLFDVFLIDASSGLQENGTPPSTNPFDYTYRFVALINYFRDQLEAKGFSRDMPMDVSEIYATLTPASLQTPTGQYALRAALWADVLKHCLVNRVRYPILWGPLAEAMGTNLSESAMITDPSVAGGGIMQIPGNVVKLFHDNFGPNTVLYQVTPSDSRIDGVANATTVLVYNKTNTTLVVGVAGANHTFAAYETKLIVR